MSVKWNAGTDLASTVENVQTLTGQRGDGTGKAVTADQLVSLGLATKKTSSGGKTTLSPPTSFPGAPDTTVSYPTKPTSFTVEGAFSFVVLIWDMPKYAGHSLTEIYRNAEDNLANAALVGTEAASVYSDSQNTGQTGYYYWIRHVNANGVPGPYNATAGTYGQTDPDAAQNLIADRVVAGIEIVTPLLISAKIQNGRFTVDENGNVVATNAVMNHVTANAGSFYDIIVTRATIQNALIAEDCTILGTLSASQINGDFVQSRTEQVQVLKNSGRKTFTYAGNSLFAMDVTCICTRGWIANPNRTSGIFRWGMNGTEVSNSASQWGTFVDGSGSFYMKTNVAAGQGCSFYVEESGADDEGGWNAILIILATPTGRSGITGP